MKPSKTVRALRRAARVVEHLHQHAPATPTTLAASRVVDACIVEALASPCGPTFENAVDAVALRMVQLGAAMHEHAGPGNRVVRKAYATAAELMGRRGR